MSKRKRYPKDRRAIHGYTSNGMIDKTWLAWKNTHDRCRNPNHRQFSYYGGRGIKVCQEWESFKGFLNDMGDSPPKSCLDRIDNDKGYNKENCRWISHSLSSLNRRLFPKNETGYTGVSLEQNRYYRSRVYWKRKSYHLGMFSTAKAAHEARETWLKQNAKLLS